MSNQINLQYKVSALYIYIWSVLRFEFFAQSKEEFIPTENQSIGGREGKRER